MRPLAFMRLFGVLVSVFLLMACASEAPAEQSSDALATSLTPQFAPEYYVDQANKIPARHEIGIGRHVLGIGARVERIEVPGTRVERSVGIRADRDFWPTYLEAVEEAGPDYYARGCGWIE